MIRISEPNLIPVKNILEKSLELHAVNIKVASSFALSDISNRQKRRPVGNPNVWYIYIGYEPSDGSSEYDLAISDIRASLVHVNGFQYDSICRYNRIESFPRFSIETKYNEQIIFDREKKTIWVTLLGLSSEGCNEIAAYISNPIKYENDKVMEKIYHIFDSAMKADFNNLNDQFIAAQEKIDEYTHRLSEYISKKAGYERRLNLLKDEGQNVLTHFNKQLNAFSKYPDINYIKFTADGKLIARTKEIIASGSSYDIVIPPVSIVVDLINKTFYYKDPETLYTGLSGKQIFHPHAIYPSTNDDNGTEVNIIKACYGTADGILISSMASNDIFYVMEILIQFLKQYNASDSAGKYYTNWKKAENATN